MGEPASGEEAFLSAFCVGDFTGLEPILGGLRVQHLCGYTKDELMKLVEDWCAKKGVGEERHQLVLPFLLHEVSVDGKQRTLATFLAQPEHAAEPDQKRLKSQVVAREEAFIKHVLSCDIQQIVWTGDQDKDPQVKCASLSTGILHRRWRVSQTHPLTTSRCACRSCCPHYCLHPVLPLAPSVFCCRPPPTWSPSRGARTPYSWSSPLRHCTARARKGCFPGPARRSAFFRVSLVVLLVQQAPHHIAVHTLCVLALCPHGHQHHLHRSSPSLLRVL